MSRRQISFVVIAIASLVVSACGVSPTAPKAGGDEIVTVGTGGWSVAASVVRDAQL